ncbi:hypothetical protein Tco_0060464 [Tanacetum coccineum]
MIEEGVTAVLAARAMTRNGDDSHTSGTCVRRNERAIRECTYQDFMKCQPLFFRGTKGVVDLTQWFERMETVFRISNCTVENQNKRQKQQAGLAAGERRQETYMKGLNLLCPKWLLQEGTCRPNEEQEPGNGNAVAKALYCGICRAKPNNTL